MRGNLRFVLSVICADISASSRTNKTLLNSIIIYLNDYSFEFPDTKIEITACEMCATFAGISPSSHRSMMACRFVPLPLIRTTRRQGLSLSLNDRTACAGLYLTDIEDGFSPGLQQRTGA